MRNGLLLLTFFVLSFTVRAQQWGVTYVQHNRSIYSVEIWKPHDISISGGNDYTASLEAIFHSTDYGLNWNECAGDTFAFCVRSIALIDSLHGFGTGFFGNYVHTIDGGVTWSRATLPINRNFFKAIYAAPSTAYLAGGEEVGSNIQTILKSTDGAATWTVVRDTAGWVLRSICFIDSLRGIAIGDTGTILRTTDGGSVWTSVTSPVVANFNSIAFINADTGYIVGGTEWPPATRTILGTTNGGITWTVLQNQSGSWLTDITFLNKDTGYIVGDSATLLQTIDGGQSWIAQTVTSAIGNESFTSVRFYNNSFGVIGSLNGEGVFVYADPAVPTVETNNVIFGYANSQAKTFLTGSVNTHGTADDISFIIGTDSLFTHRYQTPYPQEITSTSLTSSEYDITSLLNPGTYYFACVASTTSDSYYGDTVRFVIPDSAAVLTDLPITNAGATSLTLNGQVRWLPVSSDVYFEYQINGDTVVHTLAATPSTINDSLSHTISANVTNISPWFTYEYRVKAISGTEIFYSDYQNFTLGQGININILPATGITIFSATLQGQVQGLSPTDTILFEYMLNSDTTSVTTVPAVPNTVPDNLNHNVSANVSGLEPDSIYRYRLKVDFDTSGTLYSPYRYFYTIDYHNLILVTDSSRRIGLDSMMLYGHVSGLTVPANVNFSYWTNGSQVVTVPATPDLINDTSRHSVSALATGLSDNTLYNYFVTLTVDSFVQIATSIGLQFDIRTTDIVTLPATDLSATSATLNGMAQLLTPSTTVLSFDFGPSLAFGSSVAASPSFIIDTALHTVTGTVTGLLDNSMYYCRLKGTNNTATIYGDTMQLYTGTSEIPNWDFQYWSFDTVPLLARWNITTDHYQRVAGHSGDYAISLSGQNILLLGSMNLNGGALTLSNGVPYPFQPDSFVAWMKFNLPVRDSFIIVPSLHFNGYRVSEGWFQVGGSTGGTFRRFAFPMTNPSGFTPDSLMIAVLVGNRTDTVTIDDMQFTPSTAPPIPNGNFETWYDYPYQNLLSWDYLRFISSDSFPPFTGYHTVTQTYFNPPYDYAARIENIPFFDSYMPGYIGTTEGYLGSPRPSVAVNGKHTTLNGYFKYYPVNGDSMSIGIAMSKNGQWIGSGLFTWGDSVTEFTPFSVPIIYNNPSLIPDSAAIGIDAYQNAPLGHSILIVDKLHFDGLITTGISSVVPDAALEGMKLYPNPTMSMLYIQMTGWPEAETEFEVTDASGRFLSSYHSPAGAKTFSVDISRLPRGLYVITARSSSQFVSSKFVKY